ncbi:MAG: ATP-binding protein [bacterium]
MTLKKKILIGYGVSSTIMSIVIIWAIYNLFSLGKTTDSILRENYKSILASENMISAIDRQENGILYLLLGEKQIAFYLFRENELNFIEWLARAKDNVTIEGEAELVNSINDDYEVYRYKFDLIVNFSDDEEFPYDSVKSIFSETIHPLYEKIRGTCMDLKYLNEDVMYTTSEKASSVAKWAILSTGIFTLLVLLIVMILSQILAKRILSPIRRILDASRKISSGNYEIKIPIETGDELGTLAAEFNQMASKLSTYHKMNIDQILSEKNKGEAILTSIADGLVVFDMESRIISINPAARNILNLGYVDLTGIKCDKILQIPDICKVIKETIESGVYHDLPDEKRIVTLQNGETTKHYLFSVTVIKGRDLDASGVILLLKDITHLKEVEQLKSEFVMAASHELRTPLTSIEMSIDLLAEGLLNSLSESDKELLLAAQEEVNRMKALINDLLDLSKLESGKIEIDFVKVSISLIFEKVYAVFKSQVEQKNIELTTKIDGKIPKIKADANKITWVLSNLISNALRFVQEGGQICLMAKCIGSFVYFSVKDDGPGIPEEYHTKIFEKFVQVKGQKSGGTGLGLAICKEIVRAHGGTIWVDSKVGEGSTFTFTIPVV